MVEAVFVVVSSGLRTAVVVTLAERFTDAPPGAVAAAVATLTIDPASMSACVTTCEAGHTMLAPGARVTTGTAGEHEPRVALASATDTDDSVTLPVFVAVIV